VSIPSNLLFQQPARTPEMILSRFCSYRSRSDASNFVCSRLISRSRKTASVSVFAVVEAYVKYATPIADTAVGIVGMMLPPRPAFESVTGALRPLADRVSAGGVTIASSLSNPLPYF